VERDRDEWRRPWTDGSEPASAFAATTPADAPAGPEVPTARPYPQPPPETWDASDHGPGSPAGSVRPPDTTGTVIAPERPRRRGLVLAVVMAVVGAVIGSLATLGAVSRTDWFAAETVTAAPDDLTAPVINVEGDNVNDIVPTVARAVTPSVVRIDILDGEGNELGLGSGVIYTSDGYIITNNHVVEQAATLRVKLSSNESLPAELIGTDPLNDLAVVKVDRTGLPAINLRQDEEPVVGEMAIAIGSPFGLDASVTAGVVSAVGRDITVPGNDAQTRQVIPAVIQTDAAINPGNSGGALVDAEGRLLGVNTAILSATGGSQGVGFAIPVAQAVITADQLIETGVVRHAFLGVSGLDVTPEIAERLGRDDLQGAMLTLIEEGSAADDAGIQVDDIITALGDEPIASMFELAVAVRQYQPGDTVNVTFLREGEEQQVDVTLGERDPTQ